MMLRMRWLHTCFLLLSSILFICCDVYNSPRFNTWHANYQHNLRSNSSECVIFHEHNDRLNMQKLSEKYHLWPVKSHIRDRVTTIKESLSVNSTLYGMEYSLDAIYRNQHPKNCSEANYLILYPHEGGFGSVIHVYGAVLGLAMTLGRVLLPFPYDTNGWQFESPHCNYDVIDPLTNKTSVKKIETLECFYEPWSSCTIYDALGPGAVNIIERKGGLERFELSHRIVGYLEDDDFVRVVKNNTDRHKSMIAFHNERYLHGVVPKALLQMLKCSPIPKHHWYYWWRAISSTYLMRPNLRSVQWLGNNRIPGISEEGDIYSAIYVRRGDKDIEMYMVPVEDYLNATMALWSNFLVHPTTSDSYNGQHSENAGKLHRRKVFIATEDSHVLDDVIAWGNESYHNYTISSGQSHHFQGYYYDVHYTNLFNRSGLWAEKHILYKHNKAHIPVHHPEEYLSMMLNIHYLIHASGWVCTLASNFCRLVDELRAGLGRRADLPFIDLSRESCPSQFCIYEGISNFGW